MPYTLKTRDGITINNVPDDAPEEELRDRVAKIRAQRDGMESEPAQVARKREEAIGRKFQAFNTGVIDVLSMPQSGVDLVNRFVDRSQGETPAPVPPADLRMREAAGSLALPPGDEPQGALERGLRFMGGAAATFPLSFGLGQGISATGGGRTLLTKALEDTAKRPLASAATEAVASMGAGMGGQLAEAIDPESTTTQAVAELLGGLAGPLALNSPSALIARGAVGSYRAVKRRLNNETAVGARAGARLRGVVSDEQLKGLDDLPPELAQNLTLGERMQSSGLRGIEEAVASSDPAYATKAIADLEKKAIAAQDYLADLTTKGDVGAAINAPREGRREAIAQRLAAVKEAIEARAQVAGLKANMTIQAAGRETDPEEIGRMTRDIIDGEYQNARAWEKQMHAQVNKDLPVKYQNFIAAHDDEMARLASQETDPSVIPEWARKRVAAYLEDDQRTTGDLIALRQRFTDAARAEAGAEVPNRTRLTYLNKMQAALLNDLDTVPDSGAREAAAVSRELNDKFTRGAVGRLLGYEKTGELSSIPEATLREVVRGLPEEVGVNIDQLLAAAPQAKPQVENFIVNEFLDRAFVEGRFDRKLAASFLSDQKNRVMLKRFPHLMRRFTDAKAMQQEYEAGLESGSVAYNGLSDSWKKALDDIKPLDYNRELSGAMGARRGGEERIAALRKEISFDETAVKGLKADVIGEVLDRSVLDVTPQGVKVWDRAKLAKNLLIYRGRLQAAGVSESEMKRLNTILSYLERINTPVGERTVIGDASNRAMELAARVVGADVGKAYSSATGRGSTLQTISAVSAEFKRRAAGWIKNWDKAHQEIAEAVLERDEKKFRQLFTTPAPEPGKKIKLLGPMPYNFGVGVGQTEAAE